MIFCRLNLYITLLCNSGVEDLKRRFQQHANIKTVFPLKLSAF